MAPVKKQKPNKTPRKNKKSEQKLENVDESVVSGQLQKKINKRRPKPQKTPRGVVFLKHLPHGFFEEQLQKYFQQFGDVTRVRLARSRRTGVSKRYAFVEFEHPEVAKIAAETMDNYLMFKQIVKACYIPPEKQQFNYFRTSLKNIRNKSGKMVWVSGKTASVLRKMKQHNDWSEENFQKRTQKQLGKLKKLEKKYAHLGIDINEVIVQPKILTEEVQKIQEDDKIKAEQEEITVGVLKGVKIKDSKMAVDSNKQPHSKIKKELTEDLLGTTIHEDSEKEDYEIQSDSESDAEESSDEETYGFDKDSNEDDNEQSGDSESEGVVNSPIGHTKSKMIFGKTLKASNLERFDQMVKRKPHTGGVTKLKKPIKHPSKVVKNKSALKLTAAKELAKPLSRVKSKLSRPLKAKKNFIKVK